MLQYPHFLFVKLSGGESVQDSSGNWVSQPATWGLHSACREETNGKGATINGSDGKAIVFSSLLFLPRGTARIPEGTEVLVVETNNETDTPRVQGTVKKFDNGQLNTSIWI